VTSHAGDNAEGATVAASVLHFEIRTGTGGFIRLTGAIEYGRGEKFSMGENIGDKNVVLSSQFPVISSKFLVRSLKARERDESSLQDVCQFVFLRVADDVADPRQCGDFLRGTLGVTSGYYDLAFGIAATNAADRGAGVPVRFGSYGTGINHNNVGFSGMDGRAQALVDELALDDGTIGLGGAASEILHVKALHGTILT
jgi:hypothetical protein